ncbi:ABC transporter substrate-binding protein [Haematobacter genomosp. 1]|uniref:ABC transporter permease n=1 Tax=Haematobacter genomosp. 1 TaxID=366618 RepID=A0A212AFP3_9RHOB|nr:ABC transporter substrate-binding protein [Haematobacter genomosp. 1]OWJ80332.1 ABC transporter permease [Haematobacter genomosp. 1]
MKNTLMTGAAALALIAGSVAGPAAAQEAKISDGKVKIGVLNDQSGVYADTTGRTSYQAALVAVEEFGGTVLGMPIEVITADHQNKPDVASNIARQWYDTEQVDMITDLPNSAVALAVVGLSKDAKKITMVTGGGAADISGKACTPYNFHWAYDTTMLSNVVGGALVAEGGDSWFFLTSDYAFGHNLEASTTKVVEEKGGKVLGSVRHPIGTTDYSSFLLQAQASGAKVVGLASAGLDTQSAIKQASEFGIVQGGQRMAALLFTLPEVRGIGVEAGQGLVLAESYYWDANDISRELGERIKAKAGVYPNMIHAGTYSAVLQYLKAIEAAGTDDPDAVAAKLHEMPVKDSFTQNGVVWPNGRMASDVYLIEVKKPDEMKGDSDFYNILATVPGKDAYPDPKTTGCPLVQ